MLYFCHSTLGIVLSEKKKREGGCWASQDPASERYTQVHPPHKAMPTKKKPSSGDDAGACANCERRAPTMFGCARCGLVYYCGKDCQSAHWKKHKPLCIPKADRVPQPVESSYRTSGVNKSADQDEECAICLDPLAEDGSTLALPCGHAFHGSCIEGLRAQGAAKVCPLCRGNPSAGPDQLFEEAARRYFVVEARVKREQTSWAALSTANEQEMKEVAQLWKNAAAQGSFVAAFNLGVMYRTGLVMQQDNAEAVKWYRRAAEQGYAEAQFSLGLMYGIGEGEQQDNAEAVKWFHRAAEQGYAGAQYNLGVTYDKGHGVQQNYAEAVNWFSKAAEQGYAEAQYKLGVMYANGESIQQDFSKAVFWFEKAASQGHGEAKLGLEQVRLFQARASSAGPPVSSGDAQGVCCAHCAVQNLSGTSLKLCARCGIVSYCGRDCQIAHWKAGHKKSCKAHKAT